MARHARPKAAVTIALLACLWATPVQGQSLEPEQVEEAVSEEAIVDEAGTPPEDVAGIVSEAPVAVAAPLTVPELIQDAASRWGVSAQTLLRVARCESQFGTHWRTNHPSNPHVGVFQFGWPTWNEQAPRYGLGFASPYDEWANVELAAALFANGQAWRWACR